MASDDDGGPCSRAEARCPRCRRAHSGRDVENTALLATPRRIAESGPVFSRELPALPHMRTRTNLARIRSRDRPGYMLNTRDLPAGDGGSRDCHGWRPKAHDRAYIPTW